MSNTPHSPAPRRRQTRIAVVLGVLMILLFTGILRGAAAIIWDVLSGFFWIAAVAVVLGVVALAATMIRKSRRTSS